MIIKVYKYRLYPDINQRIKIEKSFNACRLVYNLALEVKMTAYKNAGINLSAYDLMRQLTEMKRDNHWLHEVDSQALQSSIKHMDNAFKRFFKGAGYPRFKKKNGKQSFTSRNKTRKVNFENQTVTVPKITEIKAVIDRPFIGAIKAIHISRTVTGKYYASVSVENASSGKDRAIVTPETTVGIDLGVKTFAVASNGIKIENPKHLPSSIKRLQVLQRRASRKKKGSNNRKKANKRVALLYERISNQRADFLHKVTTNFVRDNQAQTFCIEDLHVAGMVKNHKLARSISDASFGEFRRQMQYKCDWYGKNLIVIGRFQPSSKTCSHCQVVNETLTLSEREWACVGCGTMHDRDLNASVNIKNFGLLKHSGVGSSIEPVELRRLRRAKKQENITTISNRL